MDCDPPNNMQDEYGVKDFDMRRNLIVNYLPPTLTQEDVKELFARIGPVSNCKLIRNYATGQSLGYAFIEYPTEQLAAEAITQIDGIQMQEKKLKVSYARQSSPDIKNSNVYIAGLPAWVTEDKLLTIFSPFGTVLTHKILTNPDNTSRGVGFVRYGLKSEAEKAIESMSGKTLPESIGPLTVKLAIPPASKQNAALGYDALTTNSLTTLGVNTRVAANIRFNPLAPSNQLLLGRSGTPGLTAVNPGVSAVPGLSPVLHTAAVSVYVYGLQPTHSELTLYELFAPFGAIINVKLIRDLTKEDKPCKGYGFVNFANSVDAHTAVVSMNNIPFEDKLLQVSFKQNKTPVNSVISGAINQTMSYTNGSLSNMNQV